MDGTRTILIVGEDAGASKTAKTLGFRAVRASRLQDAVAQVRSPPPSLVLVNLPGNALEPQWLRQLSKEACPILIVADPDGLPPPLRPKNGKIRTLHRPLREADLDAALRSALDPAPTSAGSRRLSADRHLAEHVPLFDHSPAMRAIKQIIAQIADTNAIVLIRGESGVGKDLVARAIHAASPRRDRPFVKINCAALPAELLESELFGHEKGAFTGAYRRKLGKFEFANHGTLFLDEIGELPLGLQAKLLHVLQDQEFSRLGGRETIRASSPRPTGTWKQPWLPASSARTSTTASTSSRSRCRRFANGAKKSRFSSRTFWKDSCISTAEESHRTPNSSNGSTGIPGPATSASWRTSFAAWSCWTMPRKFKKSSSRGNERPNGMNSRQPPDPDHSNQRLLKARRLGCGKSPAGRPGRRNAERSPRSWAGSGGIAPKPLAFSRSAIRPSCRKSPNWVWLRNKSGTPPNSLPRRQDLCQFATFLPAYLVVSGPAIARGIKGNNESSARQPTPRPHSLGDRERVRLGANHHRHTVSHDFGGIRRQHPSDLQEPPERFH